MTVNDIIDDIIRREDDKYTNRAADRGGPTKYGVTLVTLADWRGKPVTPRDVEELTEAEAREIYREIYIIKPRFIGIQSEPVRALLIDCAVNHGVKRAVMMLQGAAHVFVDGALGPKTRDAANRMTPAALYRRICAARARFYGQIISKDPDLVRAKLAGHDLQAENAGGWMNRLAEFIEGNA